MATAEFEGTLEIDEDRGVIYFHVKQGRTLLRISSLPTPIPNPDAYERRLDVTHMVGCDWGQEPISAPQDSGTEAHCRACDVDVTLFGDDDSCPVCGGTRLGPR